MKKKRYTQSYFLPHHTYWPIIGSTALFFLAIGLVSILHNGCIGPYLIGLGAILLISMLLGWFSTVIDENLSGLHSPKMDKTYRWGMLWFIVSEVAFFGIFFLALFYIRLFVVPELGGEWDRASTHDVLWPTFKAAWPLLTNPNPTLFPGPEHVIPAWGIPMINTFLLLSSAIAVTWAQWGLIRKRRWQLLTGLALTILLGLSFLSIQAHEYLLAYTDYHLTLHSGIYGSTFFMLTGFHALHVTLGLIMLIVILIRALKNHFTPHHHFAVEAVSWYWHFVDVVWLFLFIFVYWL